MPTTGLLVFLALGHAVPAAAQVWIPEHGPEAPTWYVTGGSLSFVHGRGDSMRRVANGVGLNAFLGVMPPDVADELRVGIAVSSHGDDISPSRTELLSVYFEPYWAWPVASLWIRAAPRFAWVREFRESIHVKLGALAYGAVVSVRRAVGPRLAFERGST
ncbi:MAG: hypothetical protein PVH00_07770 [Gemmatimonadota bacterium]